MYGGFYAQGVVKDSPHPDAAKLWLEHILSDEGALGYLEGGAMPGPLRQRWSRRARSRDDLAKNLPPDDLISQIEFLTPGADRQGQAVLGENWGPMVADA